MFCKYCGKELKNDAVFCPYCGRNQKTAMIAPERMKAAVEEEDEQKEEADEASPTSDLHDFPDMDQQEEQASHAAKKPLFSSPKSVRDVFGGGVFFVLTLLVSVYIPFRLASTGSMLTYFLIIPAIVICVGCWVVFLESQKRQPSDVGFSIVGGGLMAQMLALIVYGAVFALLSAIGFFQFLMVNLDINIDIFNIHISTIGYVLTHYFTKLFILLIVVCAIIVFYCLVFIWMLRFFRSGVRSAKTTGPGTRAIQKRPVRIPVMIVSVVIVGAGSLVRLCFTSAVYKLFYFLFYPAKALIDGIFGNLFSGSLGRVANEILNSVINFFQKYSGRENETMDAVKSFFLASLENGEAKRAVTGPAIVAEVMFLGILACVIVILIRIITQSRKSGFRKKG